MTRYVVQVDGVPVAVPAGAVALSVLRNQSRPNTVFNVDEVVNAIGRPLTAREDDFLDLLHAIHITDLVCARGRNEDWTRDLALAVPLREPEAFRPLVPVLQEVFGMMTFDRLRIELAHHRSQPPQRFPTKAPTRSKPDSVALLSGGLDSACAGAQLVGRKRHPLFVSARSSSHVTRAQNAVLDTLKRRCPDVQAVRFLSQPRHQHSTTPLPQSDLSQRSRTLLYVGAAATVALAHGLDHVVLGENGIMAINCPLTLGRAAGFSTRTAHPDVLDRMETVIAGALEQPLRILNPLLLNTKVDVVRTLAKLCGGAFIKKTHSCWIARQAKHCGHCVPCLVRRFATEAAGLSDVPYLADSFHKPGQLSDEAFASIGDYLLFIRHLRSASDLDLLLDYPDLNIGGSAASVDQLVALHRKWADQVERVVKGYPALKALY